MEESDSSRARTLVVNGVVTVALFAALELTCRAIAFVKEGFNTYYLTYGFRAAGLAMTTNAVPFEGYWKFAPGSVITQGPREDLRIPSKIINAGMPSFQSDNMVAILKAELLAYKPSMLVVYAAYNDSTQVLDETSSQALARWLYDHVALYVAVKKVVERVSSMTMYSKWTPYAKAPSKDYLDRQIALHNARFRANLEQMRTAAASVGAGLVLVRQPMTTWKFLRMENARPTYQETVDATRTKVERGEAIDWEETTLLVHAGLLATLDTFAREAGFPVVDHVRIVDARRDRLQSYVHLSEEGNDALAQALVEPIRSALSRTSR